MKEPIVVISWGEPLCTSVLQKHLCTACPHLVPFGLVCVKCCTVYFPVNRFFLFDIDLA